MECPFAYSSGKRCNGYINRLKIIKANIEADLNRNNEVKDVSIWSNYHVHLYCSEKGNHAGYKRQDDPRMKIRLGQLPENVLNQIIKSPKSEE